ncbi:MAG: hypothetical protein AB7K52_10575 [Phycisphaerales bacterium]
MTQPGADLFAAGEEARLALSDAAARAERRNQPRWVLVASGGLALVGFVWLAAAWWSLSSAQSLLRRERGASFELQKRVDDYIREKDAQTAQLGEAGLRPNPNLQAQIEQAGREAGLSSITISMGEESLGATKNLQRKRYSYSMSSQPQETEAILRWIHKVQTEFAGVELTSIDLEPAMATTEGKARWKGIIAFTRWERKAN